VRVAGNDPLAKRTATKLKNDGALITALGGTTLRHHLDGKLWRERNHVPVGQLAEWVARYLYLPRLLNREVLNGAIKDGLAQLDLEGTFALAAGFDPQTGRYKGLHLRSNAPVIENTSLLVKPGVAAAQVKADEEAAELERARQKPPQPEGVTTPPPVVGTGSVTVPVVPLQPPAQPKKPNLFIATVSLNGERLGKEAGRVAEEVLQHLSTLPGAEVEVRMEIQIRVPGGVPDDVVRTVSENSKTLKFDSAGFERE